MTALDTRNVPAFLTAPEPRDPFREWYLAQLQWLYTRVRIIRNDWDGGTP